MFAKCLIGTAASRTVQSTQLCFMPYDATKLDFLVCNVSLTKYVCVCVCAHTQLSFCLCLCLSATVTRYYTYSNRDLVSNYGSKNAHSCDIIRRTPFHNVRTYTY